MNENTVELNHLIFTFHDVSVLLFFIVLVPLFAYLLGWIINFIPSFMSSILKKVDNPSMIYGETLVDKMTFKEAMVEKGEKK